MDKPAKRRCLYLNSDIQNTDINVYTKIVCAKLLHKINKSYIIPTTNSLKSSLSTVSVLAENEKFKLSSDLVTANYKNIKRSQLMWCYTYSHTDKYDRADKMTYCRPKRRKCNVEQCKKALQRQHKLRLQKFVQRLAKAREKEKRAAIWRNYINRLKLEHGLIKIYSKEQHTPNIKLTQSIVEENYRTLFDSGQAIHFDCLLHDIHKINSKLKSSGIIFVDNNPYIDTVLDSDSDRRIQLFRSLISICCPTSSQALHLKHTSDSFIHDKYKKRRLDDFSYDYINDKNSPNYGDVKRILKTVKVTANEIQPNTHTKATQYKDKKKSLKVQANNTETNSNQLFRFNGLVKETTIATQKVSSSHINNQHLIENINEKLSFLVKVAFSLTKLINDVKKDAHVSTGVDTITVNQFSSMSPNELRTIKDVVLGEQNSKLASQVLKEAREISQEEVSQINRDEFVKYSVDETNVYKNTVGLSNEFPSVTDSSYYIEEKENDSTADSVLKVLNYPERVVMDKTQIIFKSTAMITEDENNTNVTKVKEDTTLFNSDLNYVVKNSDSDSDNQDLGLYVNNFSSTESANNKKSKDSPTKNSYLWQGLGSLPEYYKNKFGNNTIESRVVNSNIKETFDNELSSFKDSLFVPQGNNDVKTAKPSQSSVPDGQKQFNKKSFAPKQRYQDKPQHRWVVVNDLNSPQASEQTDYNILLQSEISKFLNERKRE